MISFVYLVRWFLDVHFFYRVGLIATGYHRFACFFSLLVYFLNFFYLLVGLLFGSFVGWLVDCGLEGCLIGRLIAYTEG